jgi:hypothetical protein
MLRFATTDSHPLEIRIELRRPAVYLDSGVISDLAGTDKGEILRKLICAGGTLYVSWAHIVEVFGIGDGPTFTRIADYLKAFGPHFIIIDSDTNAVAKREKDWKPGLQNPAVDEEFLRQIPRCWDGMTEMSLAILFDAFRKEEGLFEGIKNIHKKDKANVKKLFDEQRQRYRDDKAIKQQFDRADYSTLSPYQLAGRVGLELARESIKTNETFNESDALDFSHAVVSAAYCDFSVLDKKWARRCRNVKLPPTSATIFDGTEIDQLLAALEKWDGSDNTSSARAG